MRVEVKDKIILHGFREVKYRCEVSELGSWERWKGNEVARWEKRKSGEVGRWEFPGFIHRVSPRFYFFVSNFNQGNERAV